MGALFYNALHLNALYLAYLRTVRALFYNAPTWFRFCLQGHMIIGQWKDLQ